MSIRNWRHSRNIALAMLLGLGIAACGRNDADEPAMESVPERVKESLDHATDRAEKRHEEAMEALEDMEGETDRD